MKCFYDLRSRFTSSVTAQKASQSRLANTVFREDKSALTNKRGVVGFEVSVWKLEVVIAAGDAWNQSNKENPIGLNTCE